jgi:hypothetical protein
MRLGLNQYIFASATPHSPHTNIGLWRNLHCKKPAWLEQDFCIRYSKENAFVHGIPNLWVFVMCTDVL